MHLNFAKFPHFTICFCLNNVSFIHKTNLFCSNDINSFYFTLVGRWSHFTYIYFIAVQLKMWRRVDIWQIKDISSIQRNQLSLQTEPNYLSSSNFVVFNLLPQSHLMDFDKTLHRWNLENFFSSVISVDTGHYCPTWIIYNLGIIWSLTCTSLKHLKVSAQKGYKQLTTPNLFMWNAVEVLSLQICHLAKHLTPLLKCNIAFLYGESIVNPVLTDSSI